MRPRVVTLGGIARRIAHRWPLVLLCTCLSLAAGIALQAFSKPHYEAAATVVVIPQTTTPFAPGQLNQQVNMESEKAIAKSQPVCKAAAETLNDGDSAEELCDSVTLAVPSQSLTLRFTVRANDARGAARRADAVAAAYLSVRSRYATEDATRLRARLQSEIEALESQAAVPGTDKPALTRKIEALREQQVGYSMVGQAAGHVVGPASVPSDPAGVSTKALLGGAGALGLLIGCFLALVHSALRTRVDADDYLKEAMACPVRPVGDVDEVAAQVRGELTRRQYASGMDAHPRVTVITVGLGWEDLGQAIATDPADGSVQVGSARELAAQGWPVDPHALTVLVTGGRVSRGQWESVVDDLHRAGVAVDLVLVHPQQHRGLRASAHRSEPVEPPSHGSRQSAID